jgi:hypothetical protein
MKPCLLHSYGIADYYHTSNMLEGTHHFLVYVDDVNIVGGRLTYHKERHRSFNSP